MPDRLTSQELRCVLLAGDGLSDKEVAVAMGIAPRTVGNNLHRAYRKLGVSDRKLAARRLSSDYSEHPLLIDHLAGRAASRTDTGAVLIDAGDLRSGEGPLLRAYRGLGAWRTPPRRHPRIVLILGGAVAIVIVLAITGQIMAGINDFLG
ncbi:helix-turn-helix transcriptional regulator [Brevundimonas sp.]|jgi:DNA-binding CsgD family transcriptional regulator|uniref:helix-turn-helix domain-containing protein n=1 Tax=Brevundimonas sp. TaxID=1871086 RepID=UPI003784B905